MVEHGLRIGREGGQRIVALGLKLESPNPRMSITTTSRSPASAAATSIQSYEKYDSPCTMSTVVALGFPNRRMKICTSPLATRWVRCSVAFMRGSCRSLVGRGAQG